MPGLDLIDGNGADNNGDDGGDTLTAADGLDLLLRNADAGTDFGMDIDDDEEDEISNAAAAAAKQKYRAEADDVLFPDEVETPADVQARQRFGKYRGLKSFRTSKWDAKESLPLEYARVYAFENPKRTEKRAKAAALRAGLKTVKMNLNSMDMDVDTNNSIIGGVADVGDYVCLHIAAVPEDVATELVARVNTNTAAPPLTVTGLLQHETKLSVVNFGIRKLASYTPPLPNKERLLFITGVRGFFTCPVFSSDEHGADKFKMERFLHQGHAAIASVYAPISYGPLPLLAFRIPFDGGKPVLVATGALRNCDPDRIVLKKIVLSGYPVKVHKMKAVVKFMFHSPDDIKWFQPVDLWTKHGRRGRIKEPIGTHGAMKCIFDGGVKQQDAVCMSLFKRVYPKWPEDMRFADV
jgi:pre-rRNA-processing protein TSR1